MLNAPRLESQRSVKVTDQRTWFGSQPFVREFIGFCLNSREKKDKSREKLMFPCFFQGFWHGLISRSVMIFQQSRWAKCNCSKPIFQYVCVKALNLRFEYALLCQWKYIFSRCSMKHSLKIGSIYSRFTITGNVRNETVRYSSLIYCWQT